MEVYYFGRRHRTRAVGEYNTKDGSLVVKKGTVVSESVAEFSKKDLVMKLRKQYTNNDGIVIEDVKFNSPSRAAMFVAGYSVNGRTAWHVKKKYNLKNYLEESN